MTPKELFQVAFRANMNCMLESAEIKHDAYACIEYRYRLGDEGDGARYFLRITEHHILHGMLKDEQSVMIAVGLNIKVLRDLLDNFEKVNLYEMSA